MTMKNENKIATTVVGTCARLWNVLTVLPACMLPLPHTFPSALMLRTFRSCQCRLWYKCGLHCEVRHLPATLGVPVGATPPGYLGVPVPHSGLCMGRPLGGCPFLRGIKPLLAFRGFARSYEAPWHTQITTESPFKVENDGAYSRCEN
jgi:hypothetical protein